MKLVIITVIFLIAAIISGASQASTYNSKVRDLYSESLIEVMVKDQKEKRRIAKQVYIFKDNPAAADREYTQLVKNLDYNKEVYTGR